MQLLNCYHFSKQAQSSVLHAVSNTNTLAKHYNDRYERKKKFPMSSDQRRPSSDFTLTLSSSEQRSDGALVPNSDEQCPRQHDQHNGDNVSSLRHLQDQTSVMSLPAWHVTHDMMWFSIIRARKL